MLKPALCEKNRFDTWNEFWVCLVGPLICDGNRLEIYSFFTRSRLQEESDNNNNYMAPF